MTNVDIDSGAIDNTVIGATTAAAGTFTTLTTTGSVTLGDAAADDITINGSLASHLIPKTDASYDLGSASLGFNDLYLGSAGVINLGGGDVTFTHSTGKLTLGGAGTVEFDFNNHEMTNVDIDSGAIDNTVIGATTAAAGTFTTLTATTGSMIFKSSSTAKKLHCQYQLM